MAEIPRKPRTVGKVRRLLRQEMDAIDAGMSFGVGEDTGYKMPATRIERSADMERGKNAANEATIFKYSYSSLLDASQEDYDSRIEEQWTRYRELDRLNQLTPEWRKWAERNRDKR